MPVRLLTSSVLKWPSRTVVLEQLGRWAQAVIQADQNVLSIGCFGSYARGTHGVGSDLDILIIVQEAGNPFVRRAAEWDTSSLPVASDVIVANGSHFPAALSPAEEMKP